jgi:N-acetylglutamate synthase-like GNAT family acetyltransferase
MINETDRAYFFLKEIPNNRLDAGPSRPQPPVQLRRLSKGHLSKQPVISKVKSIDRLTWSDRLFQMQSTNETVCTYALEKAGNIVGFLTVHQDGQDALSIDEIVVDITQREHGYGGVLLRFADTLARHSDCRAVRLNAIKDKISFYKGFDYQEIPGKDALLLDDEEYQPMERRVLYHQPPAR